MADTAFRSTRAGTYAYMSPESLMGNLQGPESDLWSLGILLYELHIGKEPFSGKSSSDMLHLISNQPIKFSSKFFSREAMKLVKALLKFKPNKRIRIEQVLGSRFVQRFREDSPLRQRVQSFEFDPPNQPFTSQFEPRHPRSRPADPRPQAPGPSLYQPREPAQPKGTRHVSRAKRPRQESVILPKIYLPEPHSASTRRVPRTEPNLANHRAAESRKKTVSDQSLGFLSKEENLTSSREIQIVSGSRLLSTARENGRKPTATTGPDRGRGAPDENKHSESSITLSLSMTPKPGDSCGAQGAHARPQPERLSRSRSIRNWRDRSRSRNRNRGASPSHEKHFIRSTNSEIKFPVGGQQLQLNSDQSQVGDGAG